MSGARRLVGRRAAFTGASSAQLQAPARRDVLGLQLAHHLGRREEAEQVCRRALSLFPEDPELLFRQGMLAHEAGRLEQFFKWPELNPSLGKFSMYSTTGNSSTIYRQGFQP